MNCPKAQNRCQAEECDFFGVTPAFAGGIESTSACRSGFITRAEVFVSAVFASRKTGHQQIAPNFDIEIFVIDKCFFVHYNKD